jgi:hypothetical protein
VACATESTTEGTVPKLQVAALSSQSLTNVIRLSRKRSASVLVCNRFQMESFIFAVVFILIELDRTIGPPSRSNQRGTCRAPI